MCKPRGCDVDECAPRVRRRLVNHALVLAVLVGVAIGFGLGFGLRQTQVSEDTLMWTGLPGEIFMRMLKVTILPVIVCSIIHGTATLAPRSHGRISLLTLGFVLLANALGSLTGIVSYYIVRPGDGITINEQTVGQQNTGIHTQDMFADLIRNIVPDNMVTACFQQSQTSYKIVAEFNATGETKMSRVLGTASGTNVIGLLFLSAVIGMATSKIGEQGKNVVLFFESCSIIFIQILKWFIWSTPVGVASLIAVSIATADSLEDTVRSLALLILAFLIGILIQELILYPAILIAIHRINPFYFYLKGANAWITVFGPPSSVIGIPEVLRLCEEEFHVDKRISRFTVPFGAAECRIGSAHFIILSVLFIANVEGVYLNPVQVVVLWVLCTFSSLATPAVPSSSLVVVVILLTSISVPGNGIAILFTMEWFHDRLRSVSNTMASTLCTITVDACCRGKLDSPNMDKATEEMDMNDTIKDCENTALV